MRVPEPTTSHEIKACCAAIYGSDWARLLIGDSMHPGGVELTRRLGGLLGLGPGSRVLDVASGRGTSAVAFAREFGCEVTGIDLSAAAVRAARHEATRAGLSGRVHFVTGDAEALFYDDGEFDAVICECAFCTFPDKRRAARQMGRVLKPGGRLGLSDLVARAELPPELRTLAGWVACLADARSEPEYIGYLESAGFCQPVIEIHDSAVATLVEQIRGRLLSAMLLVRLGKVELAGFDLDQAGLIARTASSAIQSGILGYVLLTAVKPIVSSARDRDAA